MAGMISGVRTMITRKSQEMARLTLEDFGGVIDAIVFPKVYERKRNLVRNDMIVGILGRVSFKDESEAEILAEDIVQIEDLASLRNRRFERRDSGNGYRNGGSQGGRNGGYQGDSSRHGQNDGYNGNGSPAGQHNMGAAAQNGQQNPGAVPLNDPIKLRVTEEVLNAHGEPRKVLMHLTDMMSLYTGDRDVLVYLPGQKAVRCSQDKRVTLNDALLKKLVRMLGAENVKH